MIACPDCGKVYPTGKGLGGHRWKAHGHRSQHGTAAKYGHGCRCPDCTRAHADYQRERRRRNGVMSRAEYIASSKAAAQPCGTEASYKKGRCRCDACKAAHAAYERRRRLARKAANR